MNVQPQSKKRGLRIVPCSLKKANKYIADKHRHNDELPGHKFSIAVADADGVIRGVALIGNPSSAELQKDETLAEIRRVCTDGSPNACSMLYGAARRALREMGYETIVTYTLPEEGGASLRAAGFILDKTDAGGTSKDWHNRRGRKALPVGNDLVGGKWRWLG